MRDKTELPAPESSEVSLPFFARFLEGQETSKDSFMTHLSSRLTGTRVITTTDRTNN